MRFNINVKNIYNQILTNSIRDIHYIYLVKPAEFINTNKTIYQIGKLTPKTFISNDMEIILLRKCISSKNIEKSILNNLNSKFPRYTLNNNYFVGNVDDIVETISDVIKNEREIQKPYSISGL